MQILCTSFRLIHLLVVQHIPQVLEDTHLHQEDTHLLLEDTHLLALDTHLLALDIRLLALDTHKLDHLQVICFDYYLKTSKNEFL